MALKLRKNIRNANSFIVGSADIPKGSVVIVTSSVLVVSTGNVAHVGILDEIGYIGKEVLVPGVGSIVWALAHDDAITEGLWVIPAASGRVDGIDVTSTDVQYPVGIALMDSDAQDHLIPILYLPCVVTEAVTG